MQLQPRKPENLETFSPIISFFCTASIRRQNKKPPQERERKIQRYRDRYREKEIQNFSDLIFSRLLSLRMSNSHQQQSPTAPVVNNAPDDRRSETRENAGGRKQRSFQQTRKQRSFPQPSRHSCPLCSLSLPFLLFLSYFPSFPGMSNAGDMPGTILHDPTWKTTSSTTAL
jgi:hypothetical protein